MTDGPPGSAHGRVRFAETADINRLLADAPGVRTALLEEGVPVIAFRVIADAQLTVLHRNVHRYIRFATARLAMYCRRRAPASPQLATREHVEKRHQRDETEHGPCQLRAAADIPAGGQVNPHQDHGNGMEEADQEFEDLLHCLNLPGPLWVPVRSLPAAPSV
jgi:hypothetical protein